MCVCVCVCVCVFCLFECACFDLQLSNLAWATATPQTLGKMSTDVAAAEGIQKVLGRAARMVSKQIVGKYKAATAVTNACN